MRLSLLTGFLISMVAGISINGLAADPVHFTPISPTGNNATIMVPFDINPIVNGRVITNGDEIAVFDSTGTCVGAEAWDALQNLSLTLHGDDATEPGQKGIMPGEVYRFRIWDSETDQEFNAKATYDIGDSVYVPDSIGVLLTLLGDTVVGIAKGKQPEPFTVVSVYPNPFNSETTVSYNLGSAETVSYSVYTITGQRIQHRTLGYLEPGTHTMVFDGSALSSGTYFISFTAGNTIKSISTTLLK